MADEANAGSSKTGCDSLALAHTPTPKRSSRMEAHSKLRKRRIKLLEKKLELYHRQIRRVSEMEVSLDEMKTRSSAYLKEDWLKRRFLHAWEELCALVGVSPEVQMNDHVYVRPYQGTQYPEVNRRVERLLQLGEFPDHYDVCQLVNRCNEKHSLGIKQEEIIQLSKRLFKEIGNILKKQRVKDLMLHLGCHLTDDAPEDPALSDPLLLQRLNENRHLSQRKLDDVCTQFVDKQEDEGDSTASSSDNQLAEEDEEEEYSPHPDTEQSTAGVEDCKGLADSEHRHCSNGMTDDDDESEEKHAVDNSSSVCSSPTPSSPDQPQADSSKEKDHTSSENSPQDPLYSLGVKQELEPKEESDSVIDTPPAKRARLETQTETAEQHLPASVPIKNESSCNRQDDLVVISSEEDDTAKEVIVVSD